MNCSMPRRARTRLRPQLRAAVDKLHGQAPSGPWTMTAAGSATGPGGVLLYRVAADAARFSCTMAFILFATAGGRWLSGGGDCRPSSCRRRLSRGPAGTPAFRPPLPTPRTARGAGGQAGTREFRRALPAGVIDPAALERGYPVPAGGRGAGAAWVIYGWFIRHGEPGGAGRDLSFFLVRRPVAGKLLTMDHFSRSAPSSTSLPGRFPPPPDGGSHPAIIGRRLDALRSGRRQADDPHHAQTTLTSRARPSWKIASGC